MKFQSLLSTILISTALMISLLGGCTSPSTSQTAEENTTPTTITSSETSSEVNDQSVETSTESSTTESCASDPSSSQPDQPTTQTQAEPVCAQVTRFADNEITLEYGQLSDPVSGGVGYGFEPNGTEEHLSLAEVYITNSDTLKVGDVVMVTHRIDEKTGTNYDLEIIPL